MVAIEVIRIGRTRRSAASMMASRIDLAFVAQLVGELDDQNAVLGRQRDQDDEPDLAVDVERVVEQEEPEQPAR